MQQSVEETMKDKLWELHFNLLPGFWLDFYTTVHMGWVCCIVKIVASFFPRMQIDDSAKGGLTKLLELCTVIPCGRAQKFQTLLTVLIELGKSLKVDLGALWRQR